MTKPIEVLMQKEMTRKEFIATLGLSMASILGFSTIIHLLTGKSLNSGANLSGYGGSSYGGKGGLDKSLNPHP